MAVLVGHDDRYSLRGQGYPGHGIWPSRRIGPQPATGLADGIPPDLGVLLSPARVRRHVRLYGNASHGDERSARIEQDGADALGSDIDGEQMIGRTHETSSCLS